MEPLENILRPDRNSSAPVETPQEPVPQETTQAPVAETPPVQKSDADEPESLDVNGQRMVPHEALHAEKQKTKRYTEEVADLRRQLAEDQTERRRFQQQLLERVTPQKQEQEPQQEVDFFADPTAAVNQAIQSALAPVQQHIMGMSEATSRRFAVADHGQENVNAAYQAIEQGLASDPTVRGEYQRIMASGDPWGELVRWHKRSEIIRDPEGWQQRERERIRTELLSETQSNGSQQNGQRPAPAVTPSNFAAARNVGQRGGPVWSGPKSIAEIQAERREVFKR